MTAGVGGDSLPIRYFFHMRDGDRRLDDPEGMVLPNRAAACAEALVSAGMIVRYDLALEDLWLDCVYEIADEDGRILDVVPFTAALRMH